MLLVPGIKTAACVPMLESGVVWPTTPKNRLQQDVPPRPVSCLVKIDKWQLAKFRS
jgi:hypothetical protein